MGTGYPWLLGEQVDAADLNSATFGYGTTGGSSNAYTFTTPHGSTVSYLGGMTLVVKASFSNTVINPTISVDGLAAKTIINPDGSPLSINQIPPNGVIILVYESSIGKFMLVSRTGGANILPNQRLGITSSSSAFVTSTFCSTMDIATDIIYVAWEDSGYRIAAYAPDPLTGQYYQSIAAVTATPNWSNLPGMAILGGVGYFCYYAGSVGLYSFNISTLAFTAMSFSGTAVSGNSQHPMWTDGTYLYIWQSGGTAYKYSVSGTVATYISTITLSGSLTMWTAWCDGTYVYSTNDNSGLFNGGLITKQDLTGTAVSTITKPFIFPIQPLQTTVGLFIAKGGGSPLITVAQGYVSKNGTTTIGANMELNSITKP